MLLLRISVFPLYSMQDREGSERNPHDRSHRTTSKAIADDLTADRANDHLFGSADIYTNYGSLERHDLKLLYA